MTRTAPASPTLRGRAALRTLALAAGLSLVVAGCSSPDDDAASPTPDVPAASGDAGSDTGTENATETGTETDTTTDDGGGADTGTEPDAGGQGATLEDARAGLASWLQENRPETPQTSTSIPGCPAIDVADLQEAMAQVGLGEQTLGGWGTEIEWSEYSDIDPELMGITCGGDTDGNANDSDHALMAAVIAVDVQGYGSAEEVLEAMLGLPLEQADGSPQGLDGQTATACLEESMCFAVWQEDDFVLATALLTDGEVPVSAETTTELLHSIVPTMIQSLSAL